MAGKKIVVGVDGSDSSLQALRWAARLGELTGAAVEAVTAWDYPQFYGSAGWIAPVEQPSPEDLARTVLDEALAKTFADRPPAWLSTRVEQGGAAKVLIEASKDASLLVVGSRGYSAFTEAILGSVSLACVHHATCPVTIAHGDVVL